MTASPWDGIIKDLERQIDEGKANVLEVRSELDDVSRVYQQKTAEINEFIDAEVDRIAALQSTLEHARRQRDGDPLVEALEPRAEEEL